MQPFNEQARNRSDNTLRLFIAFNIIIFFWLHLHKINLIGMIKSILAISAATIFFLVSCGDKKEPSTDEKKDTTVIGGDKDEHGCIGSAGYTWSVVKDSCIRLFERGIKLDPVDTTLDQSMV